jgi:surface polysaccharide O-acyltransferase-like enzyme
MMLINKKAFMAVFASIFDYSKEEDKNAFSLPVDLIRVFAIVCVILIHASVESYNGLSLSYSEMLLYVSAPSAYQSIAVVSVPLFAMLSGALLLRPSKAKEPIRVFLKKRLSRLGLAFVFWSGVYLAWSYLVDGAQFSFDSIIKGIFVDGAYFHFWFFYLIAGLYLATPVLRVFVSQSDTRTLRYFLLLWFVGVSVMPFLQLTTGYALNYELFLFPGYLGYFVLGAYLQRVKVRPSVLVAAFLVGIAWTLIGTWFMVFPFGSLGKYYFFFDTLSINVILTSVSLYMLLCRFHVDWPGRATHPHIHYFTHAISVNTLPIWIFHVIILESLQRGYFGFTLSLTKINPIIEIPVASLITLVITLGLIYAMKRVPILKKLIG